MVVGLGIIRVLEHHPRVGQFSKKEPLYIQVTPDTHLQGKQCTTGVKNLHFYLFSSPMFERIHSTIRPAKKEEYL